MTYLQIQNNIHSSFMQNHPYKYYYLYSLYQSDEVSNLKNKFLEMPVSEHRELSHCYYNDKERFLAKMQAYI